jgi:STE24 endopeptidase
MPSLILTSLFAAAVVLSFMLKAWLALRQMRHVAAHRGAVPAAFAGTVSLEAHQKAADYTLARGRFGLVTLFVGTVVLLGWTLLGGLDALNGLLVNTVAPAWGPMAYQVSLLAAVVLIGGVIDAPLEAWSTFRIEQRFGFNRMTWKLYLIDAVKGVLLGAALGLPIAALVLWIMGVAGGAWWWLWAWLAWTGFQLLMLVLYPTVIAPLFNKFSPLPDAALADRVSALMARCGFKSKGLFVMDGSRRSAHSNAYFTGLGAAKRVVFYDTLLSRLTPGEVEAVLAHELGHFKLKHVPKRMVAIFAISLAALALLGWLAQQQWFYSGLGVAPNLPGTAPNDALALLLLMFALPPFGFLVTPIAAVLSRQHEFEADAYACAQADGRALAQALVKLHEDNAGTLTPDPLYAKFYYSHPPAAERLAALRLGETVA